MQVIDFWGDVHLFCSIAGFGSHWFSWAGLWLDIIGFLILGADLIAWQKVEMKGTNFRIRKKGSKQINSNRLFDVMKIVEKNGGEMTASEMLQNRDFMNLVFSTFDLKISDLESTIEKIERRNEHIFSKSTRYTIFAIIFIVTGFVLQMVGAAPC